MDVDDPNSSDTNGDQSNRGDGVAHDPDGPGAPSRRWLIAGLAVVALAAVAVAVGVWLAGADEPVETIDADRAPTTGGVAAEGDEAVGMGQIDVRLEEIDGIFIEGFEVGLRFETGDGETLDAALWTEEFAEAGRTDIDAYYDGVLHRTVPAGTVVVRAEANVGAGPPASVPDLTGDLPCSVTVDVAPGQTVTLEVSFAGGDGCLRIVEPSVPTETTVPVGESTTMPG